MPRLDHNERLIIGLTLALKLGVLLLGLGAWQLVHGSGTPPFPGLELWDRWDAPHYTDLIVYGYQRDDPGNLVDPYGYRQVYPGDLQLYIVFYPLYPWLGSIVNALIHQPVLSAFIVSGIASLFVGPLMYRLVRHDEIAGRGPALRLVPADLPDRLLPAHRLHRGALHGAGARLVPGGADRALVAGGTDRRPGGADPDQRPGPAAGPAGRGRHAVVHDAAGGTALAVGVAGDRAGRRRLRDLPGAEPGDLRHARSSS